MPAEVWVCGAGDSLCEDQVDDKEEDDASSDKDLRCYGDLQYGKARVSIVGATDRDGGRGAIPEPSLGNKPTRSA